MSLMMIYSKAVKLDEEDFDTSSSSDLDSGSSSSDSSCGTSTCSSEEDGEDLEEDTTSRGRKRSQAQHQSRKKRQKEPKKVDNGNGNVTAHNLVWKFVDDMAVDAFKDTRFKPKLHVADPSTLSVIDFWLLFFPSNSTDEILHYTDAQLRSRQKLITNG